MKSANESRIVAAALIATASLVLQGCYAYPAYVPAPAQPSIQDRFNASWQAARGAAYDEGVNVTYEDRGTGTLRGTRGPASVVIMVVTQADGSIRVGFTVSGQPAQDADLQNRLTQAYNRRMGR
jgi:hypothetical protein